MRRLGAILSMTAAVLAASPGPVRADTPDPDTRSDVRCVVVAAVMVTSQDAQARAAGLVAFLYFEGRIEGRDPHYDLEGGILAEIRHMSADDMRSEGHRCGQILTARGAELQAMGRHLDSALTTVRQQGT